MANFAHRFRGFVAAKRRHELNLDEIGPDSVEWQIEPIQQKLVGRGGSKILEENIASMVGLLESKWGARAQFAGPLPSPSFTSGYTSPMVLYTDEADKEGTIAWLDDNGLGTTASHQQLAKEFSATTYSTASGTAVNMKILPLWFANGTTKLGRWASATQRKLGAAGARNWLIVGKRLYCPSAQATPFWWNMRFNPNTTTTTEVPRIFTWGNLPPLHLGQAQLAAASGSGDNNWKDGDAYFFSVLFEYEDGSLSRPFEPRPKGTTTATSTIAAAAIGTGGATDMRNGQLVLGTVGGTAYYKTITYTNLPIGGDGVVARWLLRSNKTNLSSTSTPMGQSPFDLSVIVRIANNTATTYEDSGGSDDSLSANNRVRFDGIWPPRAQYVVGADSRTVVGGNIQVNPAAIIVAPIGINTFGDVNKVDTSSSIFGSSQCIIQVTATTLKLRVAVSIPDAAPDAAAVSQITLTNKTLQQVVDEINEVTVIAAGPPVGARWGAQLVPGVDGQLLATNLAATDSGVDFGDDAVVGDSTTGNMRAFAPSYPGILYFSQTYLSTLTTDVQGLAMTSASPTVPGGNANSFFLDKSTNWKYPPSATVGRLMGLAPITGQAGVVCVAFYQHGWYVLRNTKAGGTGEDGDYRLVPLDEYDGCVSHRTVTVGPGIVGAMSEQGYSFTDANQKVLISRDVWNAQLKRGVWSAEMPAAIAQAASGNATHFFAAKLLGTKLAVTYRSDNALTYADQRIEYEFGEGADNLGLAGIMRQSDQGRPQPYGWSCPVRAHFLSVMGTYENATGRHNFGTDERNQGSTGDGRIDEFDVGLRDNAGGYSVAAGSQIASNAYTGAVPAPPFGMINPRTISGRYTSDHDLSITLYADGVTNQGLRSESYAVTLPNSGSNLYADAQINLPNAATGDKALIEWKISDDGSGTTRPEVYSLDVDYDLTRRIIPT